MQLHNARNKFEERGVNIFLVGLGTSEQAEKFRTEFSLSFPVICDPKKELYRQFGLVRGSLGSLASPSVLLRGMRTLSRGFAPGIPKGDFMQMPGVFLIDKDGNITYSYYSKNASDHPAIETLLSLL